MKFNCKVLTTALAGAMFPWGLASAGDALPFPKPLTSAGSLSDRDSTTKALQRPVLSLDARPEAFRENSVELRSEADGSSFHSVGYQVSINENMSAPMPVPMPDAGPMMNSDAMSAGSGFVQSSGCSTGNCGSGSCGSGSCGSGSCGSVGCGSCNTAGCTRGVWGRYGAGMCSTGSCGSPCCKRGWFSSDAILWWGPVTRTPELVVSGPRFNQPDTLELGGEVTTGGQMIPGMRTDFGMWIDSCQSIGLGGRFYGLFSDPSNNTFTSDGSRTLGIPYFDTSSGLTNVYLVSFDPNDAGGFDTGSIHVGYDTDFLSGDAYGRLLLSRSNCCRADIIGGYTFARLDTSIGIDTLRVDGITNTVQDGTVVRTSDSWSSRNEFHGGCVGFMTEVSRGRLALSTLGKVAIGTMQQNGLIAGSTTITDPNGAVTSSPDTGIFAQPSNRGTYSRSVLSFIPEANAKLRYQLKSCMYFNVGYTFLFLPDVATASGMIDTNLDVFGANLGSPNRPAPKFDHNCYYLHGLDLGFTIQF